MKKFSGKILLGAVSGLTLIVSSQAAKASPINHDDDIHCEYPLYTEYRLRVQESDCMPSERNAEPAGPYTS